MTLPRVRIGGIEVDTVTFDGALTEIARLVHSGHGGAVFTPNVDHIMIAERDERLRAAYARADLSLADGVPVLWASRLLGTVIPEKVSGSDLVLPLLQLAARKQWRVFLLGGAPGVAAEAADMLSADHGVIIAGIDESKVGITAAADEFQLVERICAARTDILLVALGCPKQEIFIDRNRETMGTIVSFGIGASLDFVTGRVTRAPRWISRVGLEWTYRLLQEPRRLWKRYLVQDTQFLVVVGRSLLRNRRARRAKLGQ